MSAAGAGAWASTEHRAPSTSPRQARPGLPPSVWFVYFDALARAHVTIVLRNVHKAFARTGLFQTLPPKRRREVF